MKAVEKSIIAVVKDIIEKFPQINTVITTGHSLGGALAVLCAYDLSQKFKKDKKFRKNLLEKDLGESQGQFNNSSTIFRNYD